MKLGIASIVIGIILCFVMVLLIFSCMLLEDENLYAYGLLGTAIIFPVPIVVFLGLGIWRVIIKWKKV